MPGIVAIFCITKVASDLVPGPRCQVRMSIRSLTATVIPFRLVGFVMIFTSPCVVIATPHELHIACAADHTFRGLGNPIGAFQDDRRGTRQDQMLAVFRHFSIKPIAINRSEEQTSELQSLAYLLCP